MEDRDLDHIVSLLHCDFDAQKRRKEVRIELLRMAVKCGLPQEEAVKTNLTDFFDGFLTASGRSPTRRNEAQ